MRSKQIKPFMQALQREAFEHKEELLGEVPAACLRLWTSAENSIGTECTMHLALDELTRSHHFFVFQFSLRDIE